MKDVLKKAVWAGVLLAGCAAGPEVKPQEPKEKEAKESEKVKVNLESDKPLEGSVGSQELPRIACKKSKDLVELNRDNWRRQIRQNHEGVYLVCADVNDFECPAREDMDFQTQERLLDAALPDRSRSYCGMKATSSARSPVCGPVPSSSGNGCCYALLINFERQPCL